MAALAELKPGRKVKGILPGQIVSIVDAKWHGTSAVELVYKREDGPPGTQLIYQADEASLEILDTAQCWNFQADGGLFRLAVDAAGEGINLQRAPLMINYDLPWNLNRLEQRFGRIHRIG